MSSCLFNSVAVKHQPCFLTLNPPDLQLHMSGPPGGQHDVLYSTVQYSAPLEFKTGSSEECERHRVFYIHFHGPVTATADAEVL